MPVFMYAHAIEIHTYMIMDVYLHNTYMHTYIHI